MKSQDLLELSFRRSTLCRLGAEVFNREQLAKLML